MTEVIEYIRGNNPAIWNIIPHLLTGLSSDKNENSWFLVVKLADLYYRFPPYEEREKHRGTSKLSQEEIIKHGLENNVTSIAKVENFLTIPFEINGHAILYLFVENQDLPLSVYYEVKYVIEARLNIEAKNLKLYPSILPFFLSFDEPEIDRINKKIQDKRNYFFLNGLPGMGKHTFIKNHLIYCYGFNPIDLNMHEYSEKGKIQEFNINNKKILIIDELAYCTEVDQKKIQVEIEKNNQETIIFICSAYDPSILSARGVIKYELSEMCLTERVIFPSIQKRSGSLFNILSSFLYLKGYNLLDFNSQLWLNNQPFQNGFNDILNFIQDYFLPQPSFFDMMTNDQSIREIVKNIEIRSIEYAIRIVGKSQNKIAKYLGISRGSLQHKLKKYGYSNKEWEE